MSLHKFLASAMAVLFCGFGLVHASDDEEWSGKMTKKARRLELNRQRVKTEARPSAQEKAPFAQLMSQLEVAHVNVLEKILTPQERDYLQRQYLSWNGADRNWRFRKLLLEQNWDNTLVQRLRMTSKKPVSPVFVGIVELSGNKIWDYVQGSFCQEYGPDVFSTMPKEGPSRELDLFADIFLRLIRETNSKSEARDFWATCRAIRTYARILAPYLKYMPENVFGIVSESMKRCPLDHFNLLSDKVEEQVRALTKPDKNRGRNWYNFEVSEKRKEYHPNLWAVYIAFSFWEPNSSDWAGRTYRCLLDVFRNNNNTENKLSDFMGYVLDTTAKMKAANRPRMQFLWLDLLSNRDMDYSLSMPEMPPVKGLDGNLFLACFEKAHENAHDKHLYVFIDELNVLYKNNDLISALGNEERHKYMRGLRRLLNKFFRDQKDWESTPKSRRSEDKALMCGTPQAVINWWDNKQRTKQLGFYGRELAKPFHEVFFRNASKRGISWEDGERVLKLQEELKEKAGSPVYVEPTEKGVQEALEMLGFLNTLSYGPTTKGYGVIPRLRECLKPLGPLLREKLAQPMLDTIGVINRDCALNFLQISPYLPVIPESRVIPFLVKYLQALRNYACLVNRVIKLQGGTEDSIRYIMKTLLLFQDNDVPVAFNRLMGMVPVEESYLYVNPYREIYKALKRTHHEDRLSMISSARSAAQISACLYMPIEFLPSDLCKYREVRWDLLVKQLGSYDGRTWSGAELEVLKSFWNSQLARHTPEDPSYGVVEALGRFYQRNRAHSSEQKGRSYFPAKALEINREHALKGLLSQKEEKREKWARGIMADLYLYGLAYSSLDELLQDSLYILAEPIAFNAWCRELKRYGLVSSLEEMRQEILRRNSL